DDVLVEDVEVDVDVEQVGLGGEPVDGRAEIGGVDADHGDVACIDDDRLLGAEAADVDHHDLVGRERRLDPDPLPPPGQAEAGDGRDRHRAQQAVRLRLGGVEVPMRVDPAEADLRQLAVPLLEAAHHPGHTGAVPADHHHLLAGPHAVGDGGGDASS